jgi:hypothetical protein
VVVILLFGAGVHVPLIPLIEVVGNGVSASPAQIGPTGANVGIMRGVTVKLSVVLKAHSPALGVKVKVKMPGVVVLMEGLQVPEMPLSEDEGNTGATLPWHTSGRLLKVGVSFGLMTMASVSVVAHCAAAGVKV